ncbi:Hypothetical protein CINCED_3A021138 [Cinara cedri]|uniref:Uncharacterized protein n=1 Tax=Cinara cedri TaxID=506608 RepID=A0A5E4MAF9_9HEMI|nr:Hypothetical protein CINCED_3A021138 [Cinara cedri]
MADFRNLMPLATIMMITIKLCNAGVYSISSSKPADKHTRPQYLLLNNQNTSAGFSVHQSPLPYSVSSSSTNIILNVTADAASSHWSNSTSGSVPSYESTTLRLPANVTFELNSTLDPSAPSLSNSAPSALPSTSTAPPLLDSNNSAYSPFNQPTSVHIPRSTPTLLPPFKPSSRMASSNRSSVPTPLRLSFSIPTGDQSTSVPLMSLLSSLKPTNSTPESASYSVSYQANQAILTELLLELLSEIDSPQE